MPHKHPDDYVQAGRAWTTLLVLHANPAEQAVPVLRQMANEMSADSGPAFDSDHKIRTARSTAWLAVCALLKQIETDPKAVSLTLWDDAKDAVKSWEREAE